VNIFRKKKYGGEERRLPMNAELRRHFEKEQKIQAQETLQSAQTLTSQNADRIERIRVIARVVKGRSH
jgi:hypothetical protein